LARRRVEWIGRLLLVSLALALLAPPALAVVATPSAAQEQPRAERRTLFDLLFRRNRREEVAPPRERVRRPAARTTRSSPAPAARAPAPAKVEKLADARVVLVVGDFMGGGLAEGLDTAFSENPAIRVVQRTNGSSGFVRDDYYDWPGQIGPILDEEKPAVVAVMLGSNDRQQIMIDGTRENVRSDAWTKEYEARIRALAKSIRDRGLPLVWVGLPSFKAGTMTADMLAFNDIYRSVSEEVGGEFVDIWDGFVDENGAFSQTGPDINGQRVRLRAADGINLTAAGKRKIAFYTERPLSRILGSATAPGVAALAPEGMQAMPPAVEPANIDRTPPIALGDPALDGGTLLLGYQPAKPANGRQLAPAELLAIEGMAPPAKPGRADDFSVRKLAATPPASGETTTAINE